MKRKITDSVCWVCCAILLTTICIAAGCANVNPYVVDSKQAQEAKTLLAAKEPELEFPNPHPQAQWFPDASFGLFMHWGIHSVAGLQPSWAMLKDCHWGYVPEYEAMKYYELAKRFNPENYNPDKWMAAAKKAGMQYAVLTAKHHDGYALWPSKYGNMSTRQYAGGRDLLRPYVDACRKHGLKVGFYFSPRDWHYPNYPMQAWNYDFNNFEKKIPPPIPGPVQNRKNWEKFYAYTIGQLRELLTRYGKIDVLWLDGQTWRGIDDYNTKQTLAWVRKLQPGIVINDRWINGRTFGDFDTAERNLPKKRPEGWWENCRSVNGHWGYNPNGIFWPAANMLERLVRARSWGGNFLMNVGPAPDGTMPEGYYQRCNELAEWMAHSGESVIGAGPSPGDERSNVPITTGENIWYLHVLPEHKGSVEVRNVTTPASIELLRTGECICYSRDGGDLIIELPAEQRTELVDVIALYWNNRDTKSPKADSAGRDKQIEELRQERKKLAHRKRRIIFNSDGDDVWYGIKEATREAFLECGSRGLEGTHVDTISYCSRTRGFGLFSHATKVGELWTTTGGKYTNNKTAELHAKGLDPLQMIIDFGRQNDIEIWWSMRMNDCHDATNPFCRPKLKTEHPEWLIGSEDNPPKGVPWSAVDYGRPEIRDLAFKYFQEVCENYDVDGIELDFWRQMIYFKSQIGRQPATQQQCDMMTELLRRIRKMTERVGIKRGKPILIAARVFDSVGYCKSIGIDIVSWMQEGLIDVLVVTGYFRLNPWEYSVELGHKYDVAVYPCLSESRMFKIPRVRNQGQSEYNKSLRNSLACMRARVMNVWNSGADGVYIFNHHNPRSRYWNELGEPGVLEGLDKVYFSAVRPVSRANGPLVNGTRFVNRSIVAPDRPLELKQGSVETTELQVGENIRKKESKGLIPQVKLQLRVENVIDAENLCVRLNGNKLSDDGGRGYWLQYSVRPAWVNKGRNRFEIMIKPGTEPAVTVEDLALWVRYNRTESDKTQYSCEDIESMRQARKKLAHHKRRMIFNNDGDDVQRCGKATKDAFLKLRTKGLVGTHVDTIFYNTNMCFGMCNHNTKVGTVFDTKVIPPTDPQKVGFSRSVVADFREQGTDNLEIMTDFCRDNDIEIFWSMRMNDIHDGWGDWYSEYQFPQLKKDHPEWLLGSRDNPPKRGLWTAVDYGRPEIRDLAFRFVQEVCENYDVDGVELDFFRHLNYFKGPASGQDASAQERDMMTELLRRIRKMTERVALERGRPILIAVRVPDSVDFARAVGLDLTRWMREGLIDIMTVTGYFRFNPWYISANIGHAYDVPVYACLSESRMWKVRRVRNQDRSENIRAVRNSLQCYCGRAMNVWDSGADGVYMFNLFDPNSPLWNQLGEPNFIETMDKMYCTGARGVGGADGWLANRLRFLNRSPLSPERPRTLKPDEPVTVELRVGQDLLSKKQQGIVPDVKLQLYVNELQNAEDISIKLNDKLLTGGTKSGGSLEYPVEPALVKKGINQFEFMLKQDAESEVILEDLLLWVRYGENKSQVDDTEFNQQKLQELRKIRKKLAHRKRRILVNNDGNRVVFQLKEASAEELVAPFKRGFVGTQVDTLCYCTRSSGFGLFTHNTKVGEVFNINIIPDNADNKYGFSRNRVRELIDQGTDCLEIMTNCCHDNNIEIFWSMRMNDTHDAYEDVWSCAYNFPKLKMEHPEWLMGTREVKPPRGAWTAVDYGQPEIRDLAFRFFEEVCQNYDVDGVELDFFRHAPYFRSHAWGADASQKDCDLMTGLLRRIRKMTEQVGLQRGRPILVSVRAPDSVGFARAIGLDIERWLAEDLIDIFVSTGYFRLNPWEYSIELGHKYDVPVYACLSESRILEGESGRVRSRTSSGVECYRGRAMNAWNSGADGVYIFNNCDPNSPIWDEIGDPKTLKKLDKLYPIKARSTSGVNSWASNGWSRFLNRPWWGPRFRRPLRQGEVIIFYINVGDDIKKHLAKGTIPKVYMRLHVKNVPAAKYLTVVLNDHELKNVPLSRNINESGWFEYDVDPAIMIKGKNRIKLTLWKCNAKNPELADVLLWVRYNNNK